MATASQKQGQSCLFTMGATELAGRVMSSHFLFLSPAWLLQAGEFAALGQPQRQLLT
jgi:hypothetical protein